MTTGHVVLLALGWTWLLVACIVGTGFVVFGVLWLTFAKLRA